MDEVILKVHTFEDIDELKKFFLENFIKDFSILLYNDTDFTFSVIISTKFSKDEYFYDTEILNDFPYELNGVKIYEQIEFFYPENVKFLLLIHSKENFTKSKELFFKHFVIAYQKLALIKYYENSLITSNRQLDFLNEIGDILGNFELQIVLTKILENAVNIVDGDVGVIFLKENEKLVEKISWGVPKGVIDKIINKFSNQSIIDETFKSRDMILIEDLKNNTEYHFELKDKYLINSIVTFPLYTKNNDLGVLVLINFEVDIDFVEIKTATLETLTQIASIGIENAIYFKDSIEKEKLLTELNIAANLQKQLLPEENFYTDRYYIGGFSIPARNVGGDFFNYIEKDNFLIGFVGDVAGKGIPAALLTTMAMSLLKTLIIEFNDLTKVSYKINNIISKENLGEKYFTLAIYNVDLKKNNVELVNAGHTDVLHFDFNKKQIKKYESSNLPIGMFEDVEYESINFKINKGDLIFSFSDGIPDAINEEGKRYGIERLINLIMNIYHESPETIKNTILKDVQNFCGSAEQFDDLTLMVIKIL